MPAAAGGSGSRRLKRRMWQLLSCPAAMTSPASAMVMVARVSVSWQCSSDALSWPPICSSCRKCCGAGGLGQGRRNRGWASLPGTPNPPGPSGPSGLPLAPSLSPIAPHHAIADAGLGGAPSAGGDGEGPPRVQADGVERERRPVQLGGTPGRHDSGVTSQCAVTSARRGVTAPSPAGGRGQSGAGVWPTGREGRGQPGRVANRTRGAWPMGARGARPTGREGRGQPGARWEWPIGRDRRGQLGAGVWSTGRDGRGQSGVGGVAKRARGCSQSGETSVVNRCEMGVVNWGRDGIGQSSVRGVANRARDGRAPEATWCRGAPGALRGSGGFQGEFQGGIPGGNQSPRPRVRHRGHRSAWGNGGSWGDSEPPPHLGRRRGCSSMGTPLMGKMGGTCGIAQCLGRWLCRVPRGLLEDRGDTPLTAWGDRGSLLGDSRDSQPTAGGAGGPGLQQGVGGLFLGTLQELCSRTIY